METLDDAIPDLRDESTHRLRRLRAHGDASRLDDQAACWRTFTIRARADRRAGPRIMARPSRGVARLLADLCTRLVRDPAPALSARSGDTDLTSNLDLRLQASALSDQASDPAFSIRWLGNSPNTARPASRGEERGVARYRLRKLS